MSDTKCIHPFDLNPLFIYVVQRKITTDPGDPGDPRVAEVPLQCKYSQDLPQTSKPDTRFIPQTNRSKILKEK